MKLLIVLRQRLLRIQEINLGSCLGSTALGAGMMTRGLRHGKIYLIISKVLSTLY
jgi:hypothetical protein